MQRLSSYNANVIANIVIKSDLENTLNLTLAKIESIIKANHEELLIDKSVLNTFKSDFIKLFSGYTKVRQIFKYLNLINDSYDVNKSLHYIGINVVEPKEYFDPAYISDHIRFNCQDLSQSEDQYLFMKLRSVCENRNMSKSEFISWIISSEINKHFILIGNNSSLYRNIFEDLEGFKPIWDILGINDRKHYRIGTLNEMNIFEINDNLPGATIFCLDRRLLGRLTQFLPTETNESEDFHPPFFFKVEQFASNDSLIEEYMKDPAPWLLEAGNSNAQKSKLKQSVWVRILEKLILF
ncbi:MAG: hypothetical protein IPI23_00840 [Bacteroidetes bacterium]|nr:hypothetical protein [Bacteroidota bacterium]